MRRHAGFLYGDQRENKNSSGNPKLSFVSKLDGAFHLIGAQASSTDVNMARRAVNNSLNTLDVGLHRSVGPSVGVRDVNTESHALTADIALCHLLHLLTNRDFVAP